MAKPGDPSAHVLVIRLSAMGDVAMCVPVLRTVAVTYPQLRLTMLTRSFFAPMFRGIPNLQVYPADLKGIHAGVAGLARLARELRDEEIDLVADLHNVLRSNVLGSVFRLFSIPVKQIDKGRKEKKALTREKEKRFIALKTTHQRYADVFADLGYPIALENHCFPEKLPMEEFLREEIGGAFEKWLGIAPFAQHKAKTYSKESMEKILAYCNSLQGTKILLFGGGDQEKQQLEYWEKQFEQVSSIAGRFSFQEELTLISNLDVMLSMDSGNGHLAAIYGVPVVTLWGVTHPYSGFVPFGQPKENSLLPDLEQYPLIPTSIYGNRYPEGYQEAIGSIAWQEVVKKIEQLLSQ